MMSCMGKLLLSYLLTFLAGFLSALYVFGDEFNKKRKE